MNDLKLTFYINSIIGRRRENLRDVGLSECGDPPELRDQGGGGQGGVEA